MKKWTVMLIPKDRGSTRTLNLSSLHICAAVFLVVALSFSTAFFYKRMQVTSRRSARWEEAYLQLQERPEQEASPEETALTAQERREIERRIRAEYAARDAAIASELNELYDLEDKFRQVTGLAPRKSSPLVKVGSAAQGGVGGPPGGLDEEILVEEADLNHPPQVIYGVLQPSPDLIVQEINLRCSSLSELLEDIEIEKDRVLRRPRLWPTSHPDRRISSSYGWRKDPFDPSRTTFHSGTDIVAPLRSPVRATARGEIKKAGYDRFKGNFVVIDHGYGFETVYMHLKKATVKKGENVEPGDPIGLLGNTGRSTGAHIHYEVLEKGKNVNPYKYLGN